MTAGESIVKRFRPHWKLLVVPFGWFLVAMVAIWLVYSVIPGEGLVDLILVALVVVAALFLVVRPFIDWFFTLYVLTTERLITRRGLLARHGVEIPLERITNVNFSQTVLERALGAGDLLVESAGETGQSEFANIPRPDRFQALLYKVREQRTLDLKGGERPPSDPQERLTRLDDLLRSGAISEEEHARQRARILGDV